MTQLVGILNITPDSFSDGGLYTTPELILRRADQLFTEGASLIDIGAESTRPGATVLTWEQEWERLQPILPVLMRKYPGKLSLDTYHPETAKRALELGTIIINDVTGLKNPEMQKVVIAAQARCIISHLPAAEVQVAHSQQQLDDVNVVIHDLLLVQHTLLDFGLPKQNIILDPGIGFGKTARLNHELLSFAANVPDAAVMIGYSRKRFLGDDRMDLAPNLAAADIAVQSGASYVRVHDVAGHAAHLSSA